MIIQRIVSGILFLYTFGLYAQEAALNGSASSNPVGVGERFQLTFACNAQCTKFRPPALEGLTVLSGPSQSTSIQIVNGSMTQSLSYSFIVQAKSEGKLTIGSATAEVNGKQIQSQPFALTVVKATSQSQVQAQQQAEQTAAEVALTKQVQQNLFLRVNVNKNSVIRGEQLVATYKLYTRVGLLSYTPRKMPALTGFWSQDVDNTQQLRFADETFNGQTFRVAAVKKVVLFPQQSGTLELDQMEADVVARVQASSGRRGNSAFEQLFGADPFADVFGRTHELKLTLKSQPVKITVRPLPQNNLPPEFAGGVGSAMALEASLNTKSTKTNEAVKLKVKINGKGNLKLIDPIKVSFPPDLETYDPSVTDNVAITESGASGSRSFEYLIIPRFAGDYKIPPIRYAYYDLEKKQYVMLSTQDFTLHVEKGKDDNTIITGKPGVGKESVTAIGSDIRFIKTSVSDLRQRGDRFVAGGFFLTLLLSPLLLFFGFIIYRRKTEELRGNAALMKTRGATRGAKQRLQQAKKYLATHDKNKFHDEVAKALWGYMSDKLNIEQAALTREAVAQKLLERGVSNSIVQNFALTLDACEFARFAPGEDNAAMTHLYDDAVQLISSVERELR